MNGHQAIRALRQQGLKPAFVWLLDSDHIPTDYMVTLKKTDNPEALDLRFLIGTTVLVESQDKDRLERIVEACKQAKAARVVSSLYQRTNVYHFDTVAVSDTEEVLTWQR